MLGLPMGPLVELLLGGLLDVRDLGRLAAAVGAAAFREQVLPELAAANGALVATRVLLGEERGALARWGLRVRLLETHKVAKDWWGNETEEWWQNGQPHRDGDRPALIRRRANGHVAREVWRQNGQRHRDGDRPAFIKYRADGSVESEAWYQNGKWHRDDDRPALIEYHADGSVARESWYRNGQRHRDGDRPSVVWCCADGSVCQWQRIGDRPAHVVSGADCRVEAAES